MRVVESIFNSRTVPWFGLGVGVEDALTSEYAIIKAGIDWKVMQSDLFDERWEKVKGFKLNYRDKDNAQLGIVTPKYKIVQNEDAFAFTDALIGEGVRYDSAGALYGGKKVWMTATLDDMDIDGEVVKPYLVFTNTHDGSGSVRVAITPVRVICQNMLNLAVVKAYRSWSCRHIGCISAKMDEAKFALLNANKYLEALEKEVIDLKKIRMDRGTVLRAVNELIPVDEDKLDTLKARNAFEMREELLNRYYNAPDLVDVGENGYRFVNAVSDFVTHREPNRRTESYRENVFNSVIDGNKMIDLAQRIAKSA